MQVREPSSSSTLDGVEMEERQANKDVCSIPRSSRKFIKPMDYVGIEYDLIHWKCL